MLEAVRERFRYGCEQSYTIDEYCAAERIARSTLYKLWASGKGPRWYYHGKARRISHHARIEYLQRLQAEANSSNGYRHNSKTEARPE